MTGVQTCALPIYAVAEKFKDIDCSSKIRSELGKAEKALAASKPDAAKAGKALDAAVSLFDEQKAWREKTAGLLPQMEAYEGLIRDTIGIRTLDRMPRNVALSVAACSSHHKDVSLSF